MQTITTAAEAKGGVDMGRLLQGLKQLGVALPADTNEKSLALRLSIAVFALAKEGQVIRTRQEDHLSFTFERNIVYWKEGALLGSNWKGDDTFRIDGNLYWREGGQPFDFAGVPLDEWRKRGHDVHSIVADPLFVDPEHGDFRLRPDSPAFKLGFRPIDVSGVGPRKRYSP